MNGFSRHRYGTGTCSVDRLPADELDQAVLESLLDLYSASDLFVGAVADSRSRAEAMRAQHDEEVRLVDTELRKVEEVTERHLAEGKAL